MSGKGEKKQEVPALAAGAVLVKSEFDSENAQVSPSGDFITVFGIY